MISFCRRSAWLLACAALHCNGMQFNALLLRALCLSCYLQPCLRWRQLRRKLLATPEAAGRALLCLLRRCSQVTCEGRCVVSGLIDRGLELRIYGLFLVLGV